MMEISRKILFVDDDPSILEALRRQFRAKFDVTTANGGPEALRLIESDGPFAVVVADFNMPEMNGIELLQQVRERATDTITVMLTGQADLTVAVSALHHGRIFRFLNKPCPREILEPTLRDCLEQYRLLRNEHILTSQLDHANKELQSLNNSLEKVVADRTATIRRMHRFVSELNAQDTVDEIAQLVVSTTAELLNSRRIALFMPDKSQTNLEMVAMSATETWRSPEIRGAGPSSLPGQAFHERQTIMRGQGDGGGQHQEGKPNPFDAAPYIFEPLTTTGGTLGVIWVSSPNSGSDYSAEDVALVTNIARSAATALNNQIRREERDEARDAVILALAKLAEHRDPDTGAHLERVQVYRRFLSEALSEKESYRSTIDKTFIDNIVRCSPLHDIGKVGIPDAVLLKPGRLTAAEFEIMKRHAEIGGDTIRSLIEDGRTQDFLAMGMDIAYSHHEKFDGSGYPSGLVGPAIPLPARIIAVADVYDALTSKRVYKDAMSHDEAVQIILDARSTHFDPDVVDAFLDRAEDFRRIGRQLRDHAAMPNTTSKLLKAQPVAV